MNPEIQRPSKNKLERCVSLISNAWLYLSYRDAKLTRFYYRTVKSDDPINIYTFDPKTDQEKPVTDAVTSNNTQEDLILHEDI